MIWSVRAHCLKVGFKLSFFLLIQARMTYCTLACVVIETTYLLHPPQLSSPTTSCTWPVMKTGGREGLWVGPQVPTGPLIKEVHRQPATTNTAGQKDMLELVDPDDAALIHNSCRDLNSRHHPTTKLYSAQHAMHMVHLMSGSSSLNTCIQKRAPGEAATLALSDFLD